jgi:SAM-dependent methyltransferase
MDDHGWDERYEEKELVWSADPNMFLPPIVETLEVGSALDLACGEGRNAIWLARRGWDVTGIDFSAVGIDKARKVAGDTNVHWIVADVTSYELDTKFDLVMIVYVHLDTKLMANLFSRALGALAPGGTLIAVGHALSNLTDGVGGPPFPEILWTEDRIAPLVDALDIVELTEALRPVDGSEVDAIDLLLQATAPT